MSDLPENLRGVDWSLTTFEGARREELRRWARQSLVEVISQLEEMEMLASELQGGIDQGTQSSATEIAEPAPRARAEVVNQDGETEDGS